MEQLNERLDFLKTALERLKESLKSIKDPNINTNSILFSQIRDSVIKRLEFSIDLFWKCLKDYIKDRHGIEVASPKSAIKESLSLKIINQHEFKILSKMIDDRNITSHCYDEGMAQEIATQASTYCKYMDEIANRL